MNRLRNDAFFTTEFLCSNLNEYFAIGLLILWGVFSLWSCVCTADCVFIGFENLDSPVVNVRDVIHDSFSD